MHRSTLTTIQASGQAHLPQIQARAQAQALGVGKTASQGRTLMGQTLAVDLAPEDNLRHHLVAKKKVRAHKTINSRFKKR